MIKKVLVLNYPPITSWQWQANLFAILTTDEKTFPWIFSNYIMISCAEERDENKNPMWLDFIPSGPYAMIDCPWLTTVVIERELIIDKDIEKYLIDLIDNGYYIYGFFNLKEVLNSDRVFYHDLFIYGYDKNERIFNVADFTFKSKYAFEAVDMTKLCNGYISPDVRFFEILYAKGGLLLIKKNNRDIYDFDKKLVYSQFVNYLNPKQFFDIQDVRTQYFKNKKYGIEVYDMIIKTIKRLYEYNTYDIKTLHNLYDHKVLMVMRIGYMLKNGYIDLYRNIIDEFTNIKNRMNVAWSVYLKMKIKMQKNDKGINFITDELLGIKNIEIDLYTEVLKMLENTI